MGLGHGGVFVTGYDTARALRDVAEESLFPGLTASRDRLLALAEQIEHGTPGERPFRILLAGGTGVGKSTLLNALAGETIAATGERRPTTAGFTAYIHVRDDDPWLHELPGVRLVRHRRDGLEGKVLLDSPDVDSACVDHRIMLEGAAALADLVLIVVTEEKYVSAQVLGLLADYRVGRQFGFVFNKLDQLTDRAVVEDFRRVIDASGFEDAPLFAVSARRAAPPSSGTYDSSEEFPHLAAFISEGLDQARLAGIVKTNLAQRATLAAGLVRRSLPDGWEGIGETWRQRCEELSVRSFSDIGGALTRHVLNENEITAAIAAARGASLGGVFGVVSAMAYGFRAMVPAAADRFEVLDVKIRMRMDEVIEGTFGDAVLRENCILEASRLGLDGSVVRSGMASQAPHDVSRQVVAARLPSRVRVEMERHGTPPGRWWNAVMNLPAWAWIGYWIVRTILRSLRGLGPEWDAFPGAFVILLVALVLEWTLVHRILVHGGRRRARLLVSSVLTGLEAEVVALHGRAVEPVLCRLTDHVETIKKMLLILDEVAGR